MNRTQHNSNSSISEITTSRETFVTLRRYVFLLAVLKVLIATEQWKEEVGTYWLFHLSLTKPLWGWNMEPAWQQHILVRMIAVSKKCAARHWNCAHPSEGQTESSSSEIWPSQKKWHLYKCRFKISSNCYNNMSSYKPLHNKNFM